MIRLFAALLLFVCVSPCAIAADELRKDYSDDELVDMLVNSGYRSVEIVEPGSILVTIDGLEYYIFVYDDGDLQLWFGLTNLDVSIGDMNEWNRTRRLVRAYLDDENDPILEADLLANAGYNTKHLNEWVSVFDSIARSFRDYVVERDEVNSNPNRRQTRKPG